MVFTMMLILETKKLVDNLDESLLNRFGDLVLFSESLIKLGYDFDQDAKKLSCSFEIFKYKFSKFTLDVVNLDKLVLQVFTFILYTGEPPIMKLLRSESNQIESKQIKSKDCQLG